MVAFQHINDFVEQLGLAGHNLNTDALHVALTNTAPIPTNTVLANITQISSGNGYTTNGEDTLNVWDESPAGTGRMVTTDVVWTASGGTIGPFQFVVFFNETASSPLVDPLIGWYDHGSAVTLQIDETFTVNYGATTLTLVGT